MIYGDVIPIAHINKRYRFEIAILGIHLRYSREIPIADTLSACRYEIPM